MLFYCDPADVYVSPGFREGRKEGRMEGNKERDGERLHGKMLHGGSYYSLQSSDKNNKTSNIKPLETT